MNWLRAGNNMINLGNMAYCEQTQGRGESGTVAVMVYFAGTADPLLLKGDDAREFLAGLERTCEIVSPREAPWADL